MIAEYLFPAFLIGLMATPHCVSMCGAIGGCVSQSVNQQYTGPFYSYMLLFNLGRILSYAIAGILIATLLGSIGTLTEPLRGLLWLRLLAALILLGMALHMAGLSRWILWLEQLGKPLWRRVQPHTQGLLPIQNHRNALLLGMLWGWLPCGMVYSTLSFSAASGSAVTGGLAMFLFGLGTIPALIFVASSAKLIATLREMHWLKRIISYFLALYAIFLGYKIITQLI
ncbi:hypothetical protein VST7929_01364 [Vibrio stylophorae]|uniref:Urease accessory protein UreH-like transmembrane domain-containing protein n=1 Tax=Vibrio stylophorae TaxID=659351 RepID=A0ABM8ZT51_9VIBR|nr:sulfite exporter TauE/SafE family protein [Vibrio stylophorae]CAH0533494.1 hypothetical protein VST7929_01364 [Vibrio stylophorae]